MADEHGLSEREGEVLGLLYRGNTQKRIAERLFLSVNSVQTYAKSLYRKLGVHSRQELIDMVNEAADKGDRARRGARAQGGRKVVDYQTEMAVAQAGLSQA